MTSRSALLLVVALLGCRKGLPDDGPDDTNDDTPPVDSEAPVDTEVEPDQPCDQPEVEPNDDAARANALPTEVQACGTFATENDADFWSFTLPEEGWLAVDVPGFSIGSEAYVTLSLDSADADVRVSASASGELPEAHVVFPAPVSTWSAVVRQTIGFDVPRGAGDDFFYRLRASSTKAPVDWDVEEAANDAEGAAQRLLDGEGTRRVLGDLDATDDPDWYEVAVPGAGWAVTFDVDASAFGSVADAALRVVDGQGAETVTRVGEDGLSPDPYVTLVTEGPGVVRVRVTDETGAYGRPVWYLLTARAEAP